MTDANAGATGAPSPTPTGGAPSPTPTGSAAPSPSATPNPSPTPAPNAAPTPTPTPVAGDFKVPDAYKDKPWASKVKSQEDVFKMLDGQQELIGKKTIAPIDFKTAKPEEIAKWNETMRPADVAEYGLKELGLAENVQTELGKIFHENGIPAHQGNAVVKAYSAYEKTQLEAATSADGYKKEMTTKFGDKYEAVVKASTDLHKQHLPAESQAVLEKLPNNVLAVVFELTEKMRQAYGVNETGAQVGDKSGGNIQGQDVEKTRSDLRAQIQTLSNKPHSADELQKLKDQLHATYQNAQTKK